MGVIFASFYLDFNIVRPINQNADKYNVSKYPGCYPVLGMTGVKEATVVGWYKRTMELCGNYESAENV